MSLVFTERTARCPQSSLWINRPQGVALWPCLSGTLAFQRGEAWGKRRVRWRYASVGKEKRKKLISSPTQHVPNHKLLLEIHPLVSTAWATNLLSFVLRHVVSLAAPGCFLLNLQDIVLWTELGAAWWWTPPNSVTLFSPRKRLLLSSRTGQKWTLCAIFKGRFAFIMLTFREWKAQRNRGAPSNVQPGQRQPVSHDLLCHRVYSQLSSPSGFSS